MLFLFATTRALLPFGIRGEVHFSNPAEIGNERARERGVLCFVAELLFSRNARPTAANAQAGLLGKRSMYNFHTFEKQSGKLLPVVRYLTPYGAIIIFFSSVFPLTGKSLQQAPTGNKRHGPPGGGLGRAE